MESTNLFYVEDNLPQGLPGQVLGGVRPRLNGAGALVESHPVVAEDPATQRLLNLADRVARSDVTVMLGGKSGTGKEVFARFIHARSRRLAGPFVALNCAAIPDNMLEAMLFGYEKGAFTGAYNAAPGKFEQAQGGTLLLDEISEMSLELQAKLLRVLQEREVERLGGRRLIQLDVRVLATSNRILREEVSAGRFREDLFYRLNVFPITLPQLKDRPGDILPLAGHLLKRYGGAGHPQMDGAARRALLNHSWPGNVRELENLMQRALILADDGHIGEEHLMFEMEQGFEEMAQQTAAEGHLNEGMRDVEAQIILEVLKEQQGSRKRTAQHLGISPRTLRYKLARMRDAGIDLPR
ncbi:MAG: sigma-54 dependent transcriptional regulator [Gammaproteobacteria bacterium SHHR-1]|uniref:sigma-54 interaction domain-containing protein n=1 Tax=Magnetovirga frankeli TaxID=947516 RepID=UPI0012933455|nr:sigma-54-dependent Fis family transcriptional regulator [gamma proteobacterium SS-5]